MKHRRCWFDPNPMHFRSQGSRWATCFGSTRWWVRSPRLRPARIVRVNGEVVSANTAGCDPGEEGSTPRLSPCGRLGHLVRRLLDGQPLGRSKVRRATCLVMLLGRQGDCRSLDDGFDSRTRRLLRAAARGCQSVSALCPTVGRYQTVIACSNQDGPIIRRRSW